VVELRKGKSSSPLILNCVIKIMEKLAAIANEEHASKGKETNETLLLTTDFSRTL